MAPRQQARQIAPRQQQSSGIKSPPPKTSGGGGGSDLFSLLDWRENDGKSPSTSSFDQSSFGNDDDWAADFSELDGGSNNSVQQQPPQQQQPVTPSRGFHVRQPSNSSSTPVRSTHVRQASNSSQSSGDDLFGQLDWQSNTSSSTPIRPPSPKNDISTPTSSNKSSHRRSLSASADLQGFSVDSLFQSQENTFSNAMKVLVKFLGCSDY
jgi:hypothetical protein